VADKRPHFVHLGLARTLDVHGYLVCIQRAQQRRVDRLQYSELTPRRGNSNN
jgi:hypothetical protein